MPDLETIDTGEILCGRHFSNVDLWAKSITGQIHVTLMSRRGNGCSASISERLRQKVELDYTRVLSSLKG